MKKLLILLTLIPVFSFGSELRPPSVEPEEIHHENTDPFAANDLCGKETYEQYFAPEFGLNCNTGSVKLYYQFRTISTASDVEICSFTTSMNSTFKVYGPFQSLQEGAAQIAQMVAPVVASDATPYPLHTVEVDAEENKVFILEINFSECAGGIIFSLQPETMSCSNALICENCIPQFNPGPGKYVLSAWVKEDDAPQTKTSYTTPSIEISFPSVPLTTYTLTPSGQIIDGWQRIEQIFDVPPGATDFRIKLQVASGDAFFDDIRIFPFDGSMISYVYDPVTLRLMAELDERNYAKIYEYDEEGKLTRVKKETEKGIMTIQENRENSVKKP